MLFYYTNLFLEMPSTEGFSPHKDMLKFVKNARYLKKTKHPTKKHEIPP
jgi:hypothetical protein